MSKASEGVAASGSPLMTPLFETPRVVSTPMIPDRRIFQRHLDRILDTGRFSNDGPLVRELESRISDRLGVPECVLVANATVGLQLLIAALDLSGEVLVPSFTFVATPNALRWQGLKPVFCDIDVRTHNIDPQVCERLIGSATSAILGVHLWGRGCDPEALQSLADRNGLHLFFDAAHGFDCRWEGNRLGRYGDAEVFSLHATKSFHSGEGGAITTRSTDLARELRMLRNFGFTGYDRISTIGINAKLPELSAALGLANLETYDETVAASKEIHRVYTDELKRRLDIRPIQYAEHNHCHYVVVEWPNGRFAVSRDMLVDSLHRENVIARRYFYPGCHRMTPYDGKSERTGLQKTEALCARTLVLPAGAMMEKADVQTICELIERLADG